MKVSGRTWVLASICAVLTTFVVISKVKEIRMFGDAAKERDTMARILKSASERGEDTEGLEEIEKIHHSILAGRKLSQDDVQKVELALLREGNCQQIRSTAASVLTLYARKGHADVVKPIWERNCDSQYPEVQAMAIIGLYACRSSKFDTYTSRLMNSADPMVSDNAKVWKGFYDADGFNHTPGNKNEK